MSEKRFTIKHYESTDWIYDNGKIIHTSKVVDLLNALHEENQQIKNSIQEAYENERTQIGKNVLKQLIEQIEE